MTSGEDWGWATVKDESRKVYNAFREAGGNFIDGNRHATTVASGTRMHSWQSRVQRRPQDFFRGEARIKHAYEVAWVLDLHGQEMANA